LDAFIYAHPDVLVLVAVGNAGAKGPQTISSPSGAKNVIRYGSMLFLIRLSFIIMNTNLSSSLS
jgi:hypothetical protein